MRRALTLASMTGLTLAAMTPLAIGADVTGQGVEGAGQPSEAKATPQISALADDILLGRALFRKKWTPAPSSTQASDGLGPLYNARSCEACHPGGHQGPMPTQAQASPALIIRLARPDGSPDPVYGRQIQTSAVAGLAAEAEVQISITDERQLLAEGEEVILHRPAYRLVNLAYGPLAADTALSPRLAPALHRLGAIDALPRDTFADLAAAERGTAHAGRVNDLGGQTGRFGWKAGEPDLKHQVGQALVSDIGISNPLFPTPEGDCTPRQTACLALPNGEQARLGPTEAPDPILADLAAYVASIDLAKGKQTVDPESLPGARLFRQFACDACHLPELQGVNAAGNPATLKPFSDFLLHDMGPDLADGVSEGQARGQDWRTAPLFALANRLPSSGTLTSARPRYLHDGRAESLAEAILWHGGEAKGSAEQFRAATREERKALIHYLESL